ncbi:carbon-nitrogen hydrolase family protein [Spongiactinospora sp. TRM90649]|uniref:carbon-nitrogen hydrolase family protein n=1 Tax=Spongiactinospora sp. TRM90649 TaxID=3031114 RepID=UPI0023F9EFF9|nr:carbon-nitrogen hydrolase family protein [Spongiactinospora sp. TRM90649]MDF5757491.1 carbon-nitrogen hydrolase family protein [Spongiactinospora sp. TRM90649]
MRIAAAQVRSAWLDPAAGTEKVLDYLRRAAGQNIDLVAFPETFLSGYPYWLSVTGGAAFDDPRQKTAYSYYLDAAVELDGPQLRTITEAVRDLKVFTYLGVSERAGGTVYCTLVAISPEHGIAGAHRKLMPTYEERLVWGAGDGHGLRTHDVGGVRVSGLNCWENWMPLARQSLYAQGTQVHVSVWPGSTKLTTDITRFIAREGRVYSLAAGAIISYDDVPTGFPFKEELAAHTSGYDGGSAIAGPDGRWIAEPVSGEERLVVADIDLATLRGERQNFDPAGHYNRPDVFHLDVDRRRQAGAAFRD